MMWLMKMSDIYIYIKWMQNIWDKDKGIIKLLKVDYIENNNNNQEPMYHTTNLELLLMYRWKMLKKLTNHM